MKYKLGAAKRFIGLAAIGASLGLMAACSPVDVDTEDGLMKAIVTRQKLDRAIPKAFSLVSQPEAFEPFAKELVKLYLEGSPFDRDVITILAASGLAEADPAFMKAAQSDDYKQVLQAAYGVKETKNAEIQKLLLAQFDKHINPEVKRVILDTGTTIKNPDVTAKAVSILNGNLDDTPFALLRTSCQVLGYQKDPSTIDTLIVVMFHQDGVGRSLTPDCSKALMSLGKEITTPALLEAYSLKNEQIQAYVASHPDTLTDDTVRNNTAAALATFRSVEAIPAMLEYVGSTKPIPVPGTLAIRPAGDQAWNMWATLVGAASQNSIFAINDIGVKDNAEAKEIFKNIYLWTDAYKRKFKNPIELTGTSNIEVSQRINAFRVLRENNLITPEELTQLIDVLKGEEFEDTRTFRNYARASMATDMITYLAITARAGETRSVWQVFSDMKAKEFNIPEPEADTPPAPHPNDPIVARIDAVRPAFAMAEQCDSSAACYAKELEKDSLSNYERIKAVYELGLTGDHQYFEKICDVYKSFDLFGQIYATKALANLGTKEDVPRIEALKKSLARDMSQLHYQSAKPNLENLVITLANK